MNKNKIQLKISRAGSERLIPDKDLNSDNHLPNGLTLGEHSHRSHKNLPCAAPENPGKTFLIL